MAFVTAFLWGTGLSLGLCVGLAAWAFIRPVITGENNGLMTIHEVNQLSVEALHERNQLTVSLVEQVERIADALKERNSLTAETNGHLELIASAANPEAYIQRHTNRTDEAGE